MDDVVFFATPAVMRDWLEQNHDAASEAWIGFHRRGSGRPSVTWPEAVDEALCFGWIDGVRKRIDDSSYKIRFTPRKPGSNWSAVNVARVAVLTREGRMRAPGFAAFARRTEERTGVYSYERPSELTEDDLERLRADQRAWSFFQTQPPWYRRSVASWILSAKRDETRARRLAQLVEHSANGRTVPPLTRPGTLPR